MTPFEAQPRKPAPLPARIGRYRITDRLGKGAMGVVYSARDDVMDRLVAVKVMVADTEGEPETRIRFYREAQAAGCLMHRNIVTIFDMGEEEGRVFIVMEMLKGETLGDYLKRPDPPPFEQKVTLMMHLCEGLSVAHAHGIYHRDIKPGNLFVQTDGSLKILDFGVARLATSTMTRSGFIIGTPDYMSPEQAQGKEIDQRSDIFSAGAVFYFMLTGRKPFGAPDLPTVLRKVQSEAPPPLQESEAPAALARVIMRALGKDVAERYQQFGDMLADLARFKRAYEGETRRLASSARDRYLAIEALAAECQALESWLGCASGREPAGATIEKLRAENPLFSTEGAQGLLLVPLGRARIGVVAADLEKEERDLAAAAVRLRSARTANATAEQALAAGDGQRAVALCEEALGSCPSSARVLEMMERCRQQMAQRRAVEGQIRAIMAEAAAAADTSEWQPALELCDQVLALDSRWAEAQALRARVVAAADREARDRALACQKAIERASRAVSERRFAEAENELQRAREIDRASPDIGRVETLLAEGRMAAAAASALARRANEAIVQGQSAFREGQRREAILSLRALARAEPNAPGVAAAADRLEAEDARLVAAERRAAEAAEHRERAEAALAAGDYEESVRESRAALALDPSLSGATRVLGVAQARAREIADAHARTAAVAAYVQRAEEFVSRGAFAKAAREAQRAREIDPHHAGALAVIEGVRRQEADTAAAQARELARREQDRIIEAALKAARAALRAGRFSEAHEKAEVALSCDPNQPVAHALAEQALAAMAQARASTPDDESTVDMTAGPSVQDPEDTVSLPCERPRAPAVRSRVAVAVGKWASLVMSRVRRTGAR